VVLLHRVRKHQARTARHILHQTSPQPYTLTCHNGRALSTERAIFRPPVIPYRGGNFSGPCFRFRPACRLLYHCSRTSTHRRAIEEGGCRKPASSIPARTGSSVLELTDNSSGFRLMHGVKNKHHTGMYLIVPSPEIDLASPPKTPRSQRELS
jgi:hypothetical protein